jgi:hypothetical protein
MTCANTKYRNENANFPKKNKHERREENGKRGKKLFTIFPFTDVMLLRVKAEEMKGKAVMSNKLEKQSKVTN